MDQDDVRSRIEHSSKASALSAMMLTHARDQSGSRDEGAAEL